MVTTIEYALMAGASYVSTRADVNKFPAPQGWVGVKHDNPPNGSGFEAISFIPTGTVLGTSTTPGTANEIVISFAGTYDNPLNPLTNPDLQADIGLGLGLGSTQLLQAAQYYLQVKAANPDATITLTGHSLGGGLAALVGVFFGVSATTFDQAPFANSAQAPSILNPLDVAGLLKADLLAAGYTADSLSALDNFLLVRDTAGGIPNSNLITNTRVDGELLAVLPIGAYDTINGSPATVLAHGQTSASSTDLHSQALLTAFLQSDTTATTTATGQKQSLSQVTFKLTDLLAMIFDPNLFAYPTDNPDNRNFIDHLVRHQAGNAPMPDGSIVAADKMVERFTSDLWKLAQDGGLTMSEGATLLGELNNVNKALIAFAMQFYYEDTANATNPNKQLFTDLSTAGEGNNGIQFDMADVSAKFKTAFDTNQALTLSDAKGNPYFQQYLHTGLDFTAQEQALLTSLLPYMRDWYVQAGMNGMTATDTLGRNAFMLGGSGSDILTGGAGADLLVGNKGDDILKGGAGNDTLLGGIGNDTYQYTNGGSNIDGFDIILDRDGNGSIEVDGVKLAGGEQFGDERVHRDADGRLYVNVGLGLVVDGNMLVQGYQAGNLGLNMSAAETLANPVTTLTLTGDLAPIDFDLNTAGVQNHIDNLNNVVVDANLPAPDRADYFNDSTGNDYIIGGGGNDIITAFRGGDDLIDGGAGNDAIRADGGDDVVMGGTGSDVISGGTGNDRLYADTQISVAAAISSGNTSNLNGSSGSGLKGGWLAGRSGDDTLVGNADNEVLSGGGGNDLLIGGAGNDYLLGDSDYLPAAVTTPILVYTVNGINVYTNPYNWDWTVTPGANNVYTFTTSADSVENPTDFGNDVIYAGAGDDVAWGGAGNDVIFGEGGNDQLIGGEGNDIILGGTGSDDIWGGAGSDYLEGGEGADTIQGDAGDDIIIGGAGVDQLYGGAGKDIYIYNKGDGKDTVGDTATEGNILRFGTGISSSDITLRLGSLMLDLGGGDEIHLYSRDEGGNYIFDQNNVFSGAAIGGFEFADGSSLSTAELLARGFDIDGTAGDDTLFGTNTTDRINGLGGNDTLVGLGGDDSLYGGDDADTLVGADGNDLLFGGSGNDDLHGDRGIFTILGGNDTLDGGTGNDHLTGGIGSDTYVWGRGSDQDTIDNKDTSNSLDTLRIGSGLGVSDLLITRSGNNLVIQLLGATDQITVLDHFIGAAIDYMVFENGLVLDRSGMIAQIPLIQVALSEGDDIYTGTDAGNENVLAGGGNDVVEGRAGNDVIWGGDGADILIGNDDDDALYGEAGNDRIYGDSSGGITSGGNDILDGGDGSDILEGDAGNDTLLGGEGNDYLYGNSGSGFETIATQDNDSLDGGAGDDVLWGQEGNDTLAGGAGNDSLFAGSGNDLLDGGSGNDNLFGNVGNDIYLFNLGDGLDELYENDPTGSDVDTLRFGEGIKASDITFKSINWELSIELDIGIYGTNDLIRIPYWGTDGRIERIEFADGVVWDAAALTEMLINHAPIVTGVIPNQSLLQGQALNLDVSSKFSDIDTAHGDSLIFSAALANGAASPTWLTFNTATRTFTGTPGNADVASLNLRVTVTDTGGLAVSSDFTIGVANVNDAPILAIPLVGQTVKQDTLFSYVLPSGTFTDVDTIYSDVLSYSATLADGSALPTWLTFDAGTLSFNGTPASTNVGVLNVKVVATDTGGLTSSGTFALTVSPIPTITGTSGNDTLTGTAIVEKLIGLAGNDILNGGGGADIMLGGTGDDTYVVENVGDVVTEIANEGVDTVQSSISYTLGSDVENLRLTGTAINGTGNALNNTLTGNSAANVLTGGVGDDTYVVGTGDTVTEAANEGIDTVNSSITYSLAALANVENLTLTGTNAINGTGNTLNNTLIGNSANNTLTGGAGNDTLDGAAGNDTLVGGTGDDVYIIGTGDTVTERMNEGNDTARSSITYTLAVNIENLILTGTSAINGTGNTLGNNLAGNSANNTLTGGTGADTLTGGAGMDTFVFAAGASVLAIGGTGNAGTIAGFDTITDFTLGIGGDTINTVGASTVVANATVNGTNSTLTIAGQAVKSHRITSGMITFDDADAFTSALTFTSTTDVAAVAQYLQANDIGNAGSTVAFTANLGGTAHTYLFTQGDNGGTNNLDVLVDMVGTNALGVSTTATANYILIV